MHHPVSVRPANRTAGALNATYGISNQDSLMKPLSRTRTIRPRSYPQL